jgi:hypothetical protein
MTCQRRNRQLSAQQQPTISTGLPSTFGLVATQQVLDVVIVPSARLSGGGGVATRPVEYRLQADRCCRLRLRSVSAGVAVMGERRYWDDPNAQRHEG